MLRAAYRVARCIPNVEGPTGRQGQRVGNRLDAFQAGAGGARIILALSVLFSGQLGDLRLLRSLDNFAPKEKL